MSFRKYCGSPWLPAVILLFTLVVHGLIVAVGINPGLRRNNGADFFVVYTGTRHAEQGLNPYGQDYVVEALKKYWNSAADAPEPQAGFFYPPQAMLLFWPFSLLPFKAAVSSWYLFNTLIVVGCGLIMWIDDQTGEHTKLAAAVVIAVTLLNPLSQRTFSLGQTSFIVPGACAFGYALVHRGWHWLGAAVWSFAAVKPHLAIPVLAMVPLFFGWRAAVRCAVCCVAFNFLGCMVTTGTLQTVVDFVHYSKVGPTSIGFNQVQYNQILSWNHLLYVFTGIALNLSVTGIVLGYVVMAMLLYVRVNWIQRRQPSQSLLLAMAGMASLFCSQPKGYDFVIAVLVAPYVRELSRENRWGTIALMLGAILVAFVPLALPVSIASHLHLGSNTTSILLSYRTLVVAFLTLVILACGEPSSGQVLPLTKGDAVEPAAV